MPEQKKIEEFPKSMYRDDPVLDINEKPITHLVVNSAEEQKDAEADGWEDGHSYWAKKAEAGPAKAKAKAKK